MNNRQLIMCVLEAWMGKGYPKELLNCMRWHMVNFESKAMVIFDVNSSLRMWRTDDIAVIHGMICFLNDRCMYTVHEDGAIGGTRLSIRDDTFQLCKIMHLRRHSVENFSLRIPPLFIRDGRIIYGTIEGMCVVFRDMGGRSLGYIELARRSQGIYPCPPFGRFYVMRVVVGDISSWSWCFDWDIYFLDHDLKICHILQERRIATNPVAWGNWYVTVEYHHFYHAPYIVRCWNQKFECVRQGQGPVANQECEIVAVPGMLIIANFQGIEFLNTELSRVKFIPSDGYSRFHIVEYENRVYVTYNWGIGVIDLFG